MIVELTSDEEQTHSRSSIGSAEARAPVFATTHWSVVRAAANSDTARVPEALEKLCRNYWYPLYAYVRRRGYPAPDAQDLTQSFFARLLERHWVQYADRGRGRFRTFLLTSMNRFLCDEWRRMRAQKRGGGVAHVPVQLGSAESRYGCEPADDYTPEQIYERQWATTLLDTVLQRLRAEYERQGKSKLFGELHSCLVGNAESQPYAKLAVQLEMTEGAVKLAVHRLRKRYRKLLRAEIARTLAPDENVDEELFHLFAVLSGK
ncbi:MAG TPA: sigma-70 family RNA polymerase sigma factor [Alphaproteobacteria bacterium]|nr:sigma-70 family RNA polymerase sigma factor [Alphaproteobacteria bacterium]